MNVIHEFAPAKLNLYLHITGRRPDGYHNLDSLVAFAGVGDDVRLEPSDKLRLVVEGPQAAALANEPAENNLIIKASKTLAELTGQTPNVKFTLIKNLPVASGIGGGSSDAAAALRALTRYWGLDLSDPRLVAAAAKHGQDVPACLKIENNYLTADGTTTAPALPYADIVMVNPNKALPTPDVYKIFRDGNYPFSPLAQLAAPPKDLASLITELKTRGNDLYSPATYLMPEIASIVDMIAATSGCLLSRMSGSGATCFGLYKDKASAAQAVSAIRSQNPTWWVAQTFVPYRSAT